MSSANERAAIIRLGDEFKDQRKKTFEFISSIASKVILLQPLGKGTLSPDDGDYRWHPDRFSVWDNQMQMVRASETPEFNIGCLFFDDKIDIDIDTDSAAVQAALDYYLADLPSSFQWGRKSKPRGHIAYLLRENLDRGAHARAIKALYDAPGMRIEVRGGQIKSNFFTLMPGSVHDTGELVKWDDGYDPSKTNPTGVDINDVLWRLRRASAAALIAEHVTEGNRHYFFMALAGMLVRMWKQAEDSGATENAMDRAMALDWFTLVRKLGGDEMHDTSRATSFESTWDKFLQSPTIPLKGGTELARLMGPEGHKIRNSVFRLLTEDDDYEAAEEALERFVLVKFPNAEFVDLDEFKPTNKVPDTLSEKAMMNAYTSIKIPFGGKPTPLPTFLRHSSQVQRATAIELRPERPERLYDVTYSEEEYGFEETMTFVNAWCGFLFKPWPVPVFAHDVEPFLDLVHEVLAGGDDERTDWILSWASDLFQDPGNKPGTLLAVTGPQGSGKTMFGEILGAIIGPAHYGKIGSIEDLTKEFNSRIHNKIFIQGDETGSSQRTALARDLKQLVTDDKQYVVFKGKEAIWVHNPARYYFTSNNSGDALRVEPGHERRYTIFESSAKYVGKMQHWENLVKWWGGQPGMSKVNLRKVLRFLTDYKYEKAVIRKAMQTAEKEEHQMNSLPPDVHWLISRIAEGYPFNVRYHTEPFQGYLAEKTSKGSMTFISPPPNTIDRTEWPNVVDLSCMTQDFLEWARLCGIRGSHNAASIQKLLTKINGSTLQRHRVTVRRDGTRDRPSVYSIPSADDLVYGLTKTYPSLKSQILAQLEYAKGQVIEDKAAPEDSEREF